MNRLITPDEMARDLEKSVKDAAQGDVELEIAIWEHIAEFLFERHR